MKNEIKIDEGAGRGAWILAIIFGGLIGWVFSLFVPTAVAALFGFIFCLSMLFLIGAVLYCEEKKKQERREQAEREEVERRSGESSDDSR